MYNINRVLQSVNLPLGMVHIGIDQNFSVFPYNRILLIPRMSLCNLLRNITHGSCHDCGISIEAYYKYIVCYFISCVCKMSSLYFNDYDSDDYRIE